MNQPKVLYKVVNKSEIKNSYTSARATGIHILNYEIGKITTAAPNTLGIFCFDTLKNAKSFAVFNESILVIKPLGKISKVKYVCTMRYNIDKFFKFRKNKKSVKELASIAIPGTVVVPTVFVISKME